MSLEQLQRILTTVVPQILLLLAPIGAGIWYFVKRKYDYKIKSLEIKQGVFQKSRLDAIEKYFAICTKALLQGVDDIQKIKDDKASLDLDQNETTTTELLVSFSHLQIYLTKEELEPAKKIVESSFKLYGEILDCPTNFFADKDQAKFDADAEKAIRLCEEIGEAHDSFKEVIWTSFNKS